MNCLVDVPVPAELETLQKSKPMALRIERYYGWSFNFSRCLLIWGVSTIVVGFFANFWYVSHASHPGHWLHLPWVETGLYALAALLLFVLMDRALLGAWEILNNSAFRHDERLTAGHQSEVEVLLDRHPHLMPTVAGWYRANGALRQRHLWQLRTLAGVRNVRHPDNRYYCAAGINRDGSVRPPKPFHELCGGRLQQALFDLDR